MDVGEVKELIWKLGMDISPIDLINIESFANRVIHLFEYRKGLQEVNDFSSECQWYESSEF